MEAVTGNSHGLFQDLSQHPLGYTSILRLLSDVKVTFMEAW
jgi:hypothetical protein